MSDSKVELNNAKKKRLEIVLRLCEKHPFLKDFYTICKEQDKSLFSSLVYVLYSENEKLYYVGQTQEGISRFITHNFRLGPGWKIVCIKFMCSPLHGERAMFIKADQLKAERHNSLLRMNDRQYSSLKDYIERKKFSCGGQKKFDVVEIKPQLPTKTFDSKKVLVILFFIFGFNMDFL